MRCKVRLTSYRLRIENCVSGLRIEDWNIETRYGFRIEDWNIYGYRMKELRIEDWNIETRYGFRIEDWNTYGYRIEDWRIETVYLTRSTL